MSGISFYLEPRAHRLVWYFVHKTRKVPPGLRQGGGEQTVDALHGN